MSHKFERYASRKDDLLLFVLSELFGLALLAPVLTLGLRWVLLRDRLVSGAVFWSLGKELDSDDSRYTAAEFLLDRPACLSGSTAPQSESRH